MVYVVVYWIRYDLSLLVIDFFFQAEDGIRDHCVTGVQTCALPICLPRFFHAIGEPAGGRGKSAEDHRHAVEEPSADGRARRQGGGRAGGTVRGHPPVEGDRKSVV